MKGNITDTELMSMGDEDFKIICVDIGGFQTMQLLCSLSSRKKVSGHY